MSAAGLCLRLRPVASFAGRRPPAILRALPTLLQGASRPPAPLPTASAPGSRRSVATYKPHSRRARGVRARETRYDDDGNVVAPSVLNLQVLSKEAARDRGGEIPAYPYGPRWVYKQSNHGLYGLARIRFGNNVAGRKQWLTKTRRSWRPNVHRKRLWSPALGMFVGTRVTARVVKAIDHAGGVDEYVLGERSQRIKALGPAGWALRWKVMNSDAVKLRYARERRKLGLKLGREDADRLVAAGDGPVGEHEIKTPEEEAAGVPIRVGKTLEMIGLGAGASGWMDGDVQGKQEEEEWVDENEWEVMLAEEDKAGETREAERRKEL